MANPIIPLIVIGSMAGLMFAGVVVLFTVVYQQRLIKQELRLQQKEIEHQQALLAATIRAETRERETLAQALHDGLMAQLSSIKMTSLRLSSMITAENSRAAHLTDHINETVSESIDQARNLAHLLHPPTLSAYGLVAALEQFALQFRFAEPPLEFAADTVTQRAPQETEMILYHITRELVQNAYKHAQATRISLSVKVLDNEIVLSVTDNGKGYDTRANSGQMQHGLGLKHIQSRLQLISAKQTIQSEPDQGTRIEIRSPLPAREIIHTKSI